MNFAFFELLQAWLAAQKWNDAMLQPISLLQMSVYLSVSALFM